MILLDANILLDIFDRDPGWYLWSSEQMRQLAAIHKLAINPIIYAEISTRFTAPGTLDDQLADLQIDVLDLSRGVAFLAGKVYGQYRQKGGTKNNILADFFIGSHASVLGCPLLTRDTRRYATYFPRLKLIAP
jgi:hypothetical protein